MSDYRLNDDGTAVFEFDDFTRTLRRPTLRQYRKSIEALGSMRDKVLEQVGDAEQPKGNVTVQLDLLIGWFDNVFTRLSEGGGLPRTQLLEEDENGVDVPVFEADGTTPVMVIDEDKLPAWLLNAELISDLILHWQTNPSRRGGR